MMLKAAAVWTSTLVLSLLLHSCHTQKLNVHWGPQSMMYLKGKHGRRFVTEGREVLSPPAWYSVLRDIRQQFDKPSSIVSSDKILITFLQNR